MVKEMGNNKKIVTLSIDKGVYNEYKRYCEENGFVLSKIVEKFMKEDLKKKVRK